MTAWVTGAEILEAAGATNAGTPEVAWADACAAAVNAGVDWRMAGVPSVEPFLGVYPLEFTPSDYPELVVAALLAGVEAYKRREATFGLTGYVDLQGAAVRVARDYLEGVAPIIARYATVGIA